MNFKKIATIFLFFTFSSSFYCFSFIKQNLIEKPLKQTSIVLITIDTLRADYLGFSGNPTAKTATIDKLSRRGIVFSNTYTDVPLTLPSHTSLLTGLSVLFHHVHSNTSQILSSSIPTLATIFKKRKMNTAAFISGYTLKSIFGLNRDFTIYNDKLTQKVGIQTEPVERLAKETITETIKWLRKEPSKNPFFLWMHLYDPHFPYSPPIPWEKMFIQKYLGEIAYLDYSLASFIDEIHNIKKQENVRIIILADHGEALGEHYEQTHGLQLYHETLHIPLIVIPEFCLSKELISTQFITIQNVHSIAKYSEKELKNFITENNFHISTDFSKNKTFYIETIFPFEKYHWSPIYGLMFGKWKFLDCPRPELYNLNIDPLEKTNLFDKNSNIVKIARKKLSILKKDNNTSKSQNISLAPKTRKALQALGYLTYSSNESNFHSDVKADPPLPDVKDRIKCLSDIEKGDALIKNKRFQQALFYLKRALNCNPTNPDIINNLGIAYLSENLFLKAEFMFSKAIKIAPKNAHFLNNLGITLKKRGKPIKAIECYKKAFLLDPSFLPAELNLAIITFEQGDEKTACNLLKNLLRKNPNWQPAIEVSKKICN